MSESYWTPEPLFAGRTVFCLASGPSLTPEVVEKVRDRATIVVNSSCLLAPWASVLYFTDSSWYETHREIVRDWPGLVISMSRRAKMELPAKVRRIKGVGEPTYRVEAFPRIGSPEVRQGRTSGHTAVSLALALGASRIGLLGYDMRAIDGREHHHDDYSGPRDLSLYDHYCRCFSGWDAAARKMGVTILNATPGSAITEFEFADLDTLLIPEAVTRCKALSSA